MASPAYVVDMVVKIKNPDDLIGDLQETFDNLNKWRWKLNPTKCIFRVPFGKLLGFIVSNKEDGTHSTCQPGGTWAGQATEFTA
nr:unnamed protein product [Digitaria exilis]